MKLYFILTVTVLGLQLAQALPPSPLQLEENRSYKHALKTRQITDKIARADLPDNIVPQSYTLKIRPILDPSDPTGGQWTAPGNVVIEIMPKAPTNQIVLHRHPTLNVTESSVKVTDPAGAAISVVNQTYSNDNDNFHTILLGSDLGGGIVYKVSIDFVAPVSASTAGLYRAEYKDEAGVEYRLATTQFESIGARQVFPCFDEPRWKTNFTISLGYKNAVYNTLCNSRKRVTGEKDPSLADWVWDHYDTTVRMPTYLVAIIVSNFDFNEAPEPVFGPRPVRIYGEPRYIAPGGDKAQGGGNYAANASAHLLNFLEKKYVYPYEMPKMDSVAIPNPFFAAGAMENWGLNTYRENYLIFFDGEQTWANKQQITSVLSHELAHQWFGNLVTCQTWRNIWLNEGWATYVADVGVRGTHEEWDELRERLWGNVQNALNQDVTSTAPLFSDNAPTVITYDKGGSLIRMMEGFLGEDTLTKGVVNYLKAKSYEAAVQDELFEHLTVQAVADKKLPEGKTMKEIMDTWTLQAGFPLIRVSKVGSKVVYLSQERFQPATPATVDYAPTAGELYEVPISTAVQDGALFANHTPTLWLSKNTISTSLQHDTSKWIIVNPDAMGYYRVLYDEEMTQLIRSQLKVDRSAISGLSRSQLLDDYFNFAMHGHRSIKDALDMTTFLQNDKDIEEDFVVWYPLFTHLTKPLAMFQANNGGPNHSLKDHLLPRLEAALGKLGWEQLNEDQGTRVVYRTKLLDWACALESATCLSTAKDLVDKFIADDVSPIKVDIQPMMYCGAMAGGGKVEFDFFLKKFEEAPVGTFKTHRGKLLNALSCTKDVTLLESLLALAINNTSVIGKSQADGLTAIQRVASNPLGRPLILKFLDDNFDKVTANLGGVQAITNILSTFCGYVTKATEVTAVEDFTAKRSAELAPVDAAVKSAIQLTVTNINWMDTYYKDMDDWFKATA